MATGASTSDTGLADCATTTSEAGSSEQSCNAAPLRFVSFRELRQFRLAPIKGPSPKKSLMTVANHLAHSRMRGRVCSIRHVSAQYGFTSGDCTRVTK